MKLSLIIPVRKEPYMQRTIDSFLDASELNGDVEVIVVLDGPEEKRPIEDIRVITVQFPRNYGMRAAINAGLEKATGKYIMKVDSHCAFAPGFDRIMIDNCPEDSLMIPRRYSLDDAKWDKVEHRDPVDYHYLRFPDPPPLSPHAYKRSLRNRLNIDETMSFQGSCWLANRAFFMQQVGFLDNRHDTYGTWAAEQLEIGMKYWLSGHNVKVNKLTWYAHLFKMPRHYSTGEFEHKRSSFKNNWNWATDYWIKQPGFAELVEKFWPLPEWPGDWKEKLGV